jgi:PAS domain S-box-containing protein
MHATREESAPPERQDRFSAPFDNAAIGFAVLELGGRFLAVNRPFCDMLGYTERELLSQDWKSITYPDDLANDTRLRSRLVIGEIDGYHYEKRYVRKDGRLVWVKLAVSLVRATNGQPSQTLSQVADITAHKEAEVALTRHAKELERSNADLEQFAYIASHDLQEPLRTVASYAHLLAERYGERLDDRADRWIGYIIGGVERMQRQIRDLLTLARVGTDANTIELTDTMSVVRRIWDLLADEYPDLEGSLDVGLLPTIDADPTQMDQLFHNLLGNSVKYRRPDVRLAISVSAEKRRDAGVPSWEFAIRDNGVGLDMVYAERIFEIFQRIRRDDAAEGSGIGLAICRKIVERHGGRIWVESTPGKGAAFFFTLPEHAH